jgi:predicted DNA binding CopG/RHH family protein
MEANCRLSREMAGRRADARGQSAIDGGGAMEQGRRRLVESSHGERRHGPREAALPPARLKRATRAELRRLGDLDTAEAARFWQTHEDPDVGQWVAPVFAREASDVIHLRLSRSAIRRLKAKAARAGLPFATYASSLLLRSARSEDPARKR